MLQVANQMVNMTACNNQGAESQRCAGFAQAATTHANQMLLASCQLPLSGMIVCHVEAALQIMHDSMHNDDKLWLTSIAFSSTCGVCCVAKSGRWFRKMEKQMAESEWKEETVS